MKEILEGIAGIFQGITTIFIVLIMFALQLAVPIAFIALVWHFITN